MILRKIEGCLKNLPHHLDIVNATAELPTRGEVGIDVDADEQRPFLVYFGGDVHDGEVSFRGLVFQGDTPRHELCSGQGTACGNTKLTLIGSTMRHFE